MKKITRIGRSFFPLLLIVLLLAFLSGCDGIITGDKPVINSFSASPSIITEGGSSTLSWEVTDADSVTITPGIGDVAVSSGTHSVSPNITTTYTLTATNDAGSTTATTNVTVNPPAVTYGSINISSTPAGAKVYLDGEDTGSITPIVLTDISPGTHTVKLDLYHYKIMEQAGILVTAGETTNLNWALTYAPQLTYKLQPGSDGKDADVGQDYPISNTGNWPNLYVGYYSIKNCRTYLEFDLSPNPLPAGAVIIETTLALYQYNGSTGATMNLGVYKVLNSWVESTITWNNQPSFYSQAEDSYSFMFATETWRYWHIDNLVQGWLDGSIGNYGVVLKVTDEASNNKTAIFRSSDFNDDISKRPALYIHYYIP